MAKVFAPYKKYCGISAGVTFKDGVGETSDPYLLDWFRARGYSVEDVPVKVEPPKAEDPAPVVAEKSSESKAAPKRSVKKTQRLGAKKEA